MKVDREEHEKTGITEPGVLSGIPKTESRFRITIKGTHDTDPEVLSRVVYETLTKAFGSPPITMPYAMVSGLLEFSWTGDTDVNLVILIESISRAISSSKIRNERSSLLRKDLQAFQAPIRQCPANAQYFQSYNIYDGRPIWRCSKCSHDFDSEEELKRHWRVT